MTIRSSNGSRLVARADMGGCLKVFFFEKKKQKTFIRLAAAFPDIASPDS
jgi:hypothetical protein